jgi:hypothetical protein
MPLEAITFTLTDLETGRTGVTSGPLRERVTAGKRFEV